MDLFNSFNSFFNSIRNVLTGEEPEEGSAEETEAGEESEEEADEVGEEE